MHDNVSTIDKLQPPPGAKTFVTADNVTLEVFEILCPILPATPRLTRKLAVLAKLLVKVYREEWGEDLEPEHDFWGMLRGLRRKDVFAVLAKPQRLSSVPDLVGATIATHLNQEQLVWAINADLMIGASPNPRVEPEQLPKDFPPEVIYYNDLFIDERHRHGIAPLTALTHQLTQGLLDRYAPETPVVVLTKGHRLHNPNKLMPIMSFATQMGMCKINLEDPERHDRFLFWIPLSDLAFFLEPPFTEENFGQRIAGVRKNSVKQKSTPR